MPAATRFTAQMVREFPEDGNRYEVVHGELLVTPAPRAPHQLILARLFDVLRRYLDPLGLADTCLWSPADISWDEATLVQPDLFVVAPEELSGDWRTFRTLRLVVEALSPATSRADRVVKRRVYQERGVATYWVLDQAARCVEVWHPGEQRPEIVTEVLRWQVTPEATELGIDLEALFRGLPQ